MSTGARFAPAATPVTEPFWAATARSELHVQFCLHCDAPYFVPRSFCPRCWSDDVAWRRLSGRGVVASFVVVARPAPGIYEDAPYVVALVELAEGVRMMTNLAGVAPEPDAVAVGMEVRVDFERRGELMVPVFRPGSGA